MGLEGIFLVRDLRHTLKGILRPTAKRKHLLLIKGRALSSRSRNQAIQHWVSTSSRCLGGGGGAGAVQDLPSPGTHIVQEEEFLSSCELQDGKWTAMYWGPSQVASSFSQLSPHYSTHRWASNTFLLNESSPFFTIKCEWAWQWEDERHRGWKGTPQVQRHGS